MAMLQRAVAHTETDRRKDSLFDEPTRHSRSARAGPDTLKLLHELAEVAVGTGAFSKRQFLENVTVPQCVDILLHALPCTCSSSSFCSCKFGLF